MREGTFWLEPIILVPKPKGFIPFCVDYCKFNKVSKFNVYPMPSIDELLGGT